MSRLPTLRDARWRGTTYLLTPGIRLVGGFNYVMGSGQSKSEKADAWAGILGTAITF